MLRNTLPANLHPGTFFYTQTKVRRGHREVSVKLFIPLVPMNSEYSSIAAYTPPKMALLISQFLNYKRHASSSTRFLLLGAKDKDGPFGVPYLRTRCCLQNVGHGVHLEAAEPLQCCFEHAAPQLALQPKKSSLPLVQKGKVLLTTESSLRAENQETGTCGGWAACVRARSSCIGIVFLSPALWQL